MDFLGSNRAFHAGLHITKNFLSKLIVGRSIHDLHAKWLDDALYWGSVASLMQLLSLPLLAVNILRIWMRLHIRDAPDDGLSKIIFLPMTFTCLLCSSSLLIHKSIINCFRF